MIFQWVKKLTSGKAANQAPAPATTVVAARRSTEPLRYPPADQGLVLLTPDAILASNQDLLDRLRLHAATEPANFDELYLQPLRRLAAHVNALPGTSSGLFSGEMGLFRACLELAFYAFQASDGRIFTGQEQVERRHLLEARWRYLCFLSGILFPLGKTLDKVHVADPNGAVWKRHYSGLTQWAGQAGVERVFLSWGAPTAGGGEMGASSGTAALVPVIVGAHNLQLLENDSADLVAALYDLACGHDGASRIAKQVLAGCWERVLRREEARRPQAFGRLTSGTHQGPYLIGALRAMVEEKRWVVNQSPLRADQSGLYLYWPAAAADLISWGRGKDYPGWPADPATLAELLKSANVVEGRGGDLGVVEVVSDDGEIQAALKIVNPLAVLTDFDPQDYVETRSQTLESVLEADPVAQAEQAATPNPRPLSANETATEKVQQADGIKLQHKAPASANANAEIPADVEEIPASTPPAAAAVTKQVEAPDKGPLKEAAEVRYADLVPEDLRAAIGNALQVELLGKVVKAWNSRGEGSTSMRRVENGAAITLAFLTSNMRDATHWIDAMSKVGLIYAPAQTPGMRVFKIAIPEGKSKVESVILSNLACRRLGL